VQPVNWNFFFLAHLSHQSFRWLNWCCHSNSLLK